MGLAGACRSLTSSMFVGAPLPCTASRRHSYYVLRCCYTLVQQRNLLEQRNPFPPATCGCRSTPKGQMRRLCRGLLPLQAEIQAILCNRSRPRCSRSTNSTGARGARGSARFCCPPAALRARVDDPSTRESGLTAAHQSNLQEKTQTNSSNSNLLAAKSAPLHHASLPGLPVQRGGGFNFPAIRS